MIKNAFMVFLGDAVLGVCPGTGRKKQITMKRAILLTIGAVLLAAGPGRADVESLNLANYRPGVDRAVQKALGFLATRLATDESVAVEVKGMNAVAGLAGMAFLSAGHTPGVGPYGDVVNRCIDFVLATPADGPHGGGAKGWLGRNDQEQMYGHGIATLLLCEVSGMVDPERQKKIDLLLPKALKLILDAQAVQKEERFAGGWRYKPDSPDSDLSVSGWNVMALRSARLNGAPVPAEAIEKAIQFVNRCQAGNGFGYQPGTASTAPGMAGVGLLCRELCGHHDDEINRRCGDYVISWPHHDSPPQLTSYHEYNTYYISQGLFQLGGKYWVEYAPRLYRYLIKYQRDDGGWTGWGDGSYGPLFSTSMYVLSLTVTYRQLPIYQR